MTASASFYKVNDTHVKIYFKQNIQNEGNISVSRLQTENKTRKKRIMEKGIDGLIMMIVVMNRIIRTLSHRKHYHGCGTST